jgi:hypothetical protein
MASLETIESRIFMAEDAMYRRSRELDRRLHELESRLKNLTASVHLVLCESGRIPLEAKTSTIVRAVEALQSGLDLDEIRVLAERITSLKGLVDDFEREIESPRAPESNSEVRPTRRVLAAAS